MCSSYWYCVNCKGHHHVRLFKTMTKRIVTTHILFVIVIIYLFIYLRPLAQIRRLKIKQLRLDIIIRLLLK